MDLVALIRPLCRLLDRLRRDFPFEDSEHDLLNRDFHSILRSLLVLVLILDAKPGQAVQNACGLWAQAPEVDPLHLCRQVQA